MFYYMIDTRKLLQNIRLEGIISDVILHGGYIIILSNT